MIKRLFSILATLLLTGSVSAQAPEKLSYQAVIRDATGIPAGNQSVGMSISILQGDEFGAAVYVETHSPKTNANGLVTLELGGGTVVSGTFTGINWASGPYFIKVETDIAGGSSYTLTGVSQILSVPYALHSKIAETADYNMLTHLPVLNIGNWNTAYSRGNHSGLYRSISYVPTWNEITSKPTTLSGYGITDAVNTTGTQTITGNITFNGPAKVASPVHATDAATKAYVVIMEDVINDELIEGRNGLVKDVDGNTYKTVKMGDRIWMAENLRVARYNDGTPMNNVTFNASWSILLIGAYCWYNKDSAAYAAPYGALYNWYAVNTGKLCPAGWRVPSDAEWTTLADYLGGTNIAGGKLKEAGTIHWDYPNTNATNESGFTALAGGYRSSDGTYCAMRNSGFWWSSLESTGYSSTFAWSIIMIFEDPDLFSYDYSKRCGFSVRCVRD
jgi:uncharacterized protein (TIGR02145 family)